MTIEETRIYHEIMHSSFPNIHQPPMLIIQKCIQYADLCYYNNTNEIWLLIQFICIDCIET